MKAEPQPSPCDDKAVTSEHREPREVPGDLEVTVKPIL